MPIPGTTQVAAKIAPTSLTDTYSTHSSTWGEGGWKEVSDITERDAITADRRHQGMAVWVVGEQKMYVLKNGVTNSDWVEFSSSTDSFESSLKSYYVGKFGTDKAELSYVLGGGTGFIETETDFPASGTPVNGDSYMIPRATLVTDNDPTKTNTGQTFSTGLSPMQISWDSSTGLWVERRGLNINNCLCSIGAAKYINSFASPAPNGYPIIVLDSGTYYFPDGDIIDTEILAPNAKMVFNGACVVTSKNISASVMEANATGVSGGIIATTSPDSICRINVRYAYKGASPPTGSIFQNNGPGELIINAGKIKGSSSSDQVISSQAAKIYAVIDKLIGKVAITIATGQITIVTVDRSSITTESVGGDITITANMLDLINMPTINSGRFYKDNMSLFIDQLLLQGIGAENEVPVYSLVDVPSTSSDATRNTTISAADGTKLMACWLLNKEMNRVAIKQGFWVSKIFCKMSVDVGSTTLEARICVKMGVSGTDTCTTSGTGTTRTINITNGSLTFASTDYNALASVSSYVKTPKGVYLINSLPSSTTQATILVPAGYVNETNQNFVLLRNAFGIVTSGISGTTIKAYTAQTSARLQIDLLQNMSLATLLFISTTSVSPITHTMYMDGFTRASHIETAETLSRKGRFFQAIGTDTKFTYIGKRINSVAPFCINFGVPDDADVFDNAYILIAPDSTSTGIDIDITINYNVDRTGVMNQYTTSDTTTTYTLFANTINGIPLKTLLPNAKYGTVGGVQLVLNTGSYPIYVLGVLCQGK